MPNSNAPDLNYQDALAFLENRTRFGINLGLERIEKLLEALGNPHQQKVKYIHVGGTNGKGSVTAFLASVLQVAGYKTGAFTSPHLHSYCERIVINGVPIPQKDAAALLNQIIPVLNQLEAAGLEPPTEFEVSTALALTYFTEKQADFAVMEVGMGGAIDSTNVITPELAVITNVAMDHMAYLGDTIEEIAAVKAGIIKPRIPVITGAKTEKAWNIIKNQALQKNSPFLALGQQLNWSNRRLIEGRQIFDCTINAKAYHDLVITLLGEHQIDNAVLAVTAAHNLGLSEQAIKEGLLKTTWPGRLEVISRNPLVVLDGAHNEDGIRALGKALNDYWPNQKKIAVIGMLADKEREKAMDLLLPHLNYAVVTKVPSHRAGNWQMITEICQSRGLACEEEEKVGLACAKALKRLEPGAEAMILVTGSLYMLAEAREWWLKYMHKLVLASGSPRRRELMRDMGLDFEVLPAAAAEKKTGQPQSLVVENALMKAEAAAKLRPGRYVLGADTVVALDGLILGKPKDEAGAVVMLNKLSGNWHSVFTGIALVMPNSNRVTGWVESKVKFKKLSQAEIEAYVATGEPLDKAGSYGIQGLGGALVEKIQGSYDNIVGLPCQKLAEILAKAGYKQ